MQEQLQVIEADALVYLRAEAKIEPLVCGWHAWAHLICPAQHALNVLFRHIPLMQSFLRNPAAHVAASADRSLFGGPFVNLPHSRIFEVRELLLETQSRCDALIRFARDYRHLDEMLQNSATGFSLGEFYSQLPESLGGLVEFLYDINHHPKLRICEELLYEESLSVASQEIMLSLQRDEERPFFMSTPRLKSPDAITTAMLFSDPRLDLLASTRTRAAPFGELVNAFNIEARHVEAFRRLFTREAPPRFNPEYAGEGVRLRYFGHACVLIQTAGMSLLIDPMLTRDADAGDQRFTIHDLPDRLDYVVLSHGHQDHFSPEILLQLRHRVGCVVVPRNNSGSIGDPSMRLALRSLGFERILVLDPFEEIPIPGGRITGLPFPGEHVDLDIYSRHGVHIEVGGRKFAFLVDSDGRDSALYRRALRRVGKAVDALFLGMECHGAPLSWLYGPLLTKAITRKNDESRRLSGLDAERAWRVLQEFEARNVFVYAMGQEPWLAYIMGLRYEPDAVQLKEVGIFIERCKQANVAARLLYISAEVEFGGAETFSGGL